MVSQSTNKLLYKELSFKLNGMFFKVHNKLGRFCREKQYSDQLEKLLITNNIEYKREVSINTIVVDSPKGNIADFIIENKIVVDLKAKRLISRDDYYQIKRYLNASRLKLGLIVNFQSRLLSPKRILNSDLLVD